MQRQVRAFDTPPDELRLVHVRSERGHDADMGRMLDEGPQRIFVLPSGERPESLRERTSQKRIPD